MKLLDGKQLAEHLLAELRTTIQSLKETPGLGVLLVGEDPGSEIYVTLKERAATEIGMRTDILRLRDSTTTEELIAHLQELNIDPSIHGILVQLPLPAHIDTPRILSLIEPTKDVDGLIPQQNTTVPPVHEAALRLAAAGNFRPLDSKTVIIAKSPEYRESLTAILKRAGSRVEDFIPDKIDWQSVKEADLLITAAGKINLIKGADIKPGVILIDVGINQNRDGKIVGDVDAASCADIPGFRSPVPGGVGPLTIACLLKNVLMAISPLSGGIKGGQTEDPL